MFLSMFISCLFLSTFITCSPRTHSPFYMPYCASYATYITLHPLYVPYSIYTSHLWVFPAPILPIHPPRGFSPPEASLYAHFASKPYSPHIISGFFCPSPPAPRPPRGFSPRKFPLCAHFSNISSSSFIISGLFLPPPLPYAHHVGFLPGNFLSTPISPA